MNDHRPSRRRVVLTVVVVGFFVGGWLDRQAETPVELPDAGRIFVISDAGPVVVHRAERLEIMRHESWLLRPPRWELARDDDEVVVRSRCGSFWPCRSTLDVGIPDGADVVIVASAGSVHLNGVDANVTVHSLADHGAVTLGSLRGSGRILARNGKVTGHALGLTELEVRALDADISLDFVTPPDRLRAETGDHAVKLSVPDSRYELLVAGGADLDGDVESIPGAGHVLAVTSSGSVVIETGR